MLRDSVVQGHLNDRGNYGVLLLHTTKSMRCKQSRQTMDRFQKVYVRSNAFTCSANDLVCAAAVADLPDQQVVNIVDPTQMKFKQPGTEKKS